MSAPRRDLTFAKLQRSGVPEEEIERLKADKEHAETLARLAASASSRGAAVSVCVCVCVVCVCVCILDR
jgi:hypothetical protein